MLNQKLYKIDSTTELLQYFTSTAVTFAELDNSMAATGIGSGFAAGDKIVVAASAQTANNTTHTIATVAADKITVTSDTTITDDNEGETITVSQVYIGNFQIVENYAKLVATVYCSGNAKLDIDFSQDGVNADYSPTQVAITGGTGAIETTEVCAKYARLRVTTNATDQTILRATLYGRTVS
jgi:hypothetical protein